MQTDNSTNIVGPGVLPTRARLVYLLPFFLGLFATTFSYHKPTEDYFVYAESAIDPWRRLIFGGIYLLALILLVHRGRSVWAVLRNHWAYIFFLGFVLLSSVWAANPWTVIKLWFHYVGFMLIGLTTALAVKGDDRGIIKSIIVYVSLAILICLLVVALFPGRGIQASGRWMGLTSHPNDFGVIALLAVWAGTTYFFYARALLIKLWCVLLIGLSAVSLWGSDSVTSAVLSLCVLAAIPVLSFLGGRKGGPSAMRMASVVLLVMIAIFIGYLVAPEVFGLDYLTRKFLHATVRDVSLTGRTELWRFAFSLYRKNPILGVGFESPLPIGNNRFIHSHMHNGYLDLLIRGGLIGAMFVFYFLAKMFYYLLRTAPMNWRRFAFLSVLIVAILAHNMTESSLALALHLWWLVFTVFYFYLGRQSLVVSACALEKITKDVSFAYAAPAVPR